DIGRDFIRQHFLLLTWAELQRRIEGLITAAYGQGVSYNIGIIWEQISRRNLRGPGERIREDGMRLFEQYSQAFERLIRIARGAPRDGEEQGMAWRSPGGRDYSAQARAIRALAWIISTNATEFPEGSRNAIVERCAHTLAELCAPEKARSRE